MEWTYQGIVVAKSQGEDGSEYEIQWRFREIFHEMTARGANHMLSGVYTLLQNGEELAVFQTFKEAPAEAGDIDRPQLKEACPWWKFWA